MILREWNMPKNHRFNHKANELIVLGDTVYESDANDLYQYRVYPKGSLLKLSPHSSYWYINEDRVGCFVGQKNADSDDQPYVVEDLVCVQILGYTPEERSSTYSRGADLPYVNGCATKQLIAPNRLGDPTWQYLSIPAGSCEQSHHIHSTARVVYVLSGRGTSIVGMPSVQKEYELKPGMVIILPKMTPHHFTAAEDGLVVIPLHIFSSTSLENNHPMFTGTHLV